MCSMNVFLDHFAISILQINHILLIEYGEEFTDIDSLLKIKFYLSTRKIKDISNFLMVFQFLRNAQYDLVF